MTRCQYDGGVLAWSDRQYASMEAGHVEVCPFRRCVYTRTFPCFTDSPLSVVPPPAWAVVDCADVTSPRAIIVENVLDFRRWRLFPEWLSALGKLGYRITEHRVCAADYGVPQLRERLFIVAHKRRSVALPLRLAVRPPFAPCIEATSEGWRHVSRASEGAQARIAAGRRLGSRYLVQHTTGHRGVPLDEPIRTVTTKDQWILVDGDQYRSLTLREYARAMGFPDGYRWLAELARADVVKGLGNAVCPPVATALIDVVAAA